MPRWRGDDERSTPGGEPERVALRVEAVDVVPTDLGSFLVRVAGAWEAGATRREAAPELVLVDGEEERRFAALAETSEAAVKAAPEADAFRATFSVPEALGAALGEPLRLAIGAALVELPAARFPGAGAEPAAGATVIDRAVLAERRARRAEMAEEANAERAQEAEGALRDLESELAKLEVRLERAVAERAGLEAQAAEREREARAAAQREYAERRRREEAAAEASRRVDDAEESVLDLRSRLRDAESRAVTLSREAESLRRRAAEAEHALATADAARNRAERLAAELGDWIETAEATEGQSAAGEIQPPPEPPAAASQPAESSPGGGQAAEPPGASPPAEPGPSSARPTASLATLGQPMAVLRAEAALARRAVSEVSLGRDAGRQEIERALEVVAEAERRVREAVAALRQMTAQLRAEREAHETEVRGLAADLDRERIARATAERSAAAAEQRIAEARAEIEQAIAGERDARTQAEHTLQRDLEAERRARAAAEAAAEDERRARAEAEQAARAALDVAERGGEAQARMSAVVEELQGELDTIKASARTEEPELQEVVSTAAESLRQAEHRIAEAHLAAAELAERIEDLEGALLVERAARVEMEASLAKSAASAEAEPQTAADDTPADEPPAGAKPDAAEGAPAEEPVAAPAAWLPHGLELMLERDRAGAVQLLLDLVASQALNAEEPVEYRLVLADEGTWGVSLRPGSGAVVPADDRRPAAFQLRTDPQGLLALLVDGGSRKLRRRVKVSGTYRRRRALKRVPPGVLRPGPLAEAEVWLDPLLLLRALAHLIDPAWTAGHDFVVAHEITGPRGRTLWVQATGDGPLAVLAAPPRTPTTVTVQTTQSAFQRFLGGEAGGPERWAIRGDVSAVEVLSGWLARARNRK